ncbi:MAG: hypothetical protein QW465_02995 [Candidatus Anstonellales archaeon]
MKHQQNLKPEQIQNSKASLLETSLDRSIDRRAFLKLALGSAALLSLPSCVPAVNTSRVTPDMNPNMFETYVAMNIERPLNVIHYKLEAGPEGNTYNILDYIVVFMLMPGGIGAVVMNRVKNNDIDSNDMVKTVERVSKAMDDLTIEEYNKLVSSDSTLKEYLIARNVLSRIYTKHLKTDGKTIPVDFYLGPANSPKNHVFFTAIINEDTSNQTPLKFLDLTMPRRFMIKKRTDVYRIPVYVLDGMSTYADINGLRPNNFKFNDFYILRLQPYSFAIQELKRFLYYNTALNNHYYNLGRTGAEYVAARAIGKEEEYLAWYEISTSIELRLYALSRKFKNPLLSIDRSTLVFTHV